MRVLLTQSLAILFAGCIFSSTSHAQLVGHWNFDSNDLTETSGFAPAGVHDGIAVGPVAFDSIDTPSGEGSSLLLDGASYVRILNSDANEPTNTGYLSTFDGDLQSGMSIAFFSRGVPGRWAPMISKFGEDDATNGVGGFQVRMRNRGPSPTFTLRGTGGEPDPQDTVATADDITGEWQHFAGVWDPTEIGVDPETGEPLLDPDTGEPIAGTRKLYVDGALIFTVIGDAGPYTVADNFSLLLGARDNAPDGSSVGNILTGGLDEVYIYQNAITAEEVSELASIAVTSPVLLGDANCDNTVNFLDINPFIELLSSGNFKAQADLNMDGEVTFLDIAPFIQALANAG